MTDKKNELKQTDMENVSGGAVTPDMIDPNWPGFGPGGVYHENEVSNGSIEPRKFGPGGIYQGGEAVKPRKLGPDGIYHGNKE